MSEAGRRPRTWWRWTFIGGLAVTAGLLVSVLVFRYAAMQVQARQGELVERLEAITGVPVTLSGLRLGVHGFRPRLLLDDVRLDVDADGGPALRLREVRLDFSVPRLLRGDYLPLAVEVAGLTLNVTRDDDGRWRIGSLGDDGSAAFDADALLRGLSRFDRIVVADLDVRLIPEGAADAVPLVVERLRMQRRDWGWQVIGDARFADVPLRAAVRGQVAGRPEQPRGWRHQWQLRLHGDLPARPAHRALLPGWPDHLSLDDVDLRFDVELGGGASGGARFQHRIARARAAGVATLGDIRLRGDWTPRAGGGVLRIDELALRTDAGAWPASSARFAWQREADGELQLRADAGYLRLDELVPWLQATGAWPHALPMFAMRGELRGVDLRADLGDDLRRLDYRAQLHEVMLRGPRGLVEHLDGELSGRLDGGQLRLEPGALTVGLPQVLAVPLRFSQAAGDLRWQRAGDGWLLSSEDLALSLDDLSAAGAASLRLVPGAAPEVDARLRFAGGDLQLAKTYIPRAWQGPLRRWLSEDIGGGRISDGTLTLRGGIDAFPWPEDVGGRFAIDLRLRDGRVRFGREWPWVEAIDATVRFAGNSLQAEVADARIGGGEVRHASVAIPGFGAAELEVEGRIEGDLAGFYGFVADSPLAGPLAALLDSTRGEGAAQIDIEARVPLRNVRATRVGGVVNTRSATLHLPEIGDALHAVEGRVHFENRRLWSEALSAEFRGQRLRGQIAAHDGVPRLTVETRAELDGEVHGVASFIPPWLRARLRGVTPVTLQLDLGPSPTPGLHLHSTLLGLHIDLPAPLNAAPDAAQPLQGVLRGVQAEGERPGGLAIDLRWGDRMHAVGLGRHWRLHAGGGALPPAPNREGLYLTGSVPELDLPGWLRFAVAAPEGSDGHSAAAPALPLRSARLHAERLRAGEVELRNLSVALDTEGAIYRIRVAGGASGELSYYANRPGHFEGRFDALTLHGDVAATLTRESGQDALDDAAAPFDPAAIPTLDLLANAVQFNGLDVGSLDVRTQRTVDGMRLEHLRLGGPALQGLIQGQWRRPEVGDGGLALRFELASDRPAAVLRALGYADSISARHLGASGELRWPGIGRGVALSAASGQLQVEASDGALHAVEPGAGRMLGLFNIYAVPRRLTLNFRDVVGDGLAFDHLGGGFRLDGGNAYTDDLRIVGPSLRIDVSGRVGLAARDYDQRIRVVPDVSGGVTIGALLLGGPAAGLLTLIARELIEKPLDQVTQFSYRLTGSWDNPQVTPGDGTPLPATDTPSP